MSEIFNLSVKNCELSLELDVNQLKKVIVLKAFSESWQFSTTGQLYIILAQYFLIYELDAGTTIFHILHKNYLTLDTD